MKPEDLMIIAGAGLAVFLFYNFMDKKKTAGTSQTGYVRELDILNAGGWQYFEDGTSISPDGSYYFHGDLVYKPS